MKKLIFGVLVLVFGVVGAAPVGALDVDNYTISSYDVQMTLGRDGEGRSTLKTVETITAQFPDYDQNHGLERVFVKEYDGHNTSFNLASVTDANGAALPYHWSDDALRVGDSDVYVRGSQTYVITYTERDITRYYADTDKDEFYWDAIGTEWRVPIQNASVRLVVDPSLAPALTNGKACYQGVFDSDTTCDLVREGSSYTTRAAGLQRNEGITVAVGFAKGTFAGYQQTLGEKLAAIWAMAQVGILVVSIAVIVWLVARWYRLIDRKKELGTIVPEYLPPKEASVTTSARVAGLTRSIMTAQLLDLAVRHYIKIYEVKKKTLFGAAEYEIEVIKSVSDLRWEEQELLSDTFGETPAVGARLNLKTLKNSTSYYRRTLNNDTDLDKRIRGEYGLRAVDEELKKWLRRAARILLIAGILLLSPPLLVATLVAFGLSFVCYRLTDNGLMLKRYVEGLKLYISVAETERINMLQSPEGAEKVASVASGIDSAQLVKLYEKVLPYAVLFGQEKEWNKQLGHYYEVSNTNPDWYGGNNAVFNAVIFSSAMNSFSQANTTASSSSSSSGGSSGGGSSGGGGGGGGGGGW